MFPHKKILLLLILSFNLPGILLAQTDSSYIETENVLEDILQEPTGQSDDSNLFDILEQLKRNPIDLNKADISDLQQIPGVDLHTAQIIIKHRKRYGNFFSTQELYAVQGIGKDEVKMMMPFIKVIHPSELQIEKEQEQGAVNQILGNTYFVSRSRFSNDLQTRRGFLEEKFQGSKPKIYNRFYLKYMSNYQFGYIAEKDAGESALNEFYSVHFAIKNLGFIKTLVISDYLVEFGQGLVLWSPYGFSKGSDAIYPLKKKGRYIRPYSSATENNFFRGAAASIKLNDFIVSGFFSKNKFDAHIDTVTGEILSAPVSGFHRTQSEISKKNAAEEKVWGARIDYSKRDLLSAGFLYYNSNFSNPFLPKAIFNLKGNSFNYYSFYYDLILSGINVFGELAYNGTSVASINSFQLSVSRDFAFIASIRSYPRNYISLHGYAFGERSGATNNEFGIYTGIKWRTSIGLLNFYYDQFKFPYATYNNPMPSEGDEFLIDLLSKPFEHVATRIRFKYENKDITVDKDNRKQLVKRLRQVFRFELIYNIAGKLRLKGRFEYNNYRVASVIEKENGYLFFQDIRYAPSSHLNIYGRVIFFRTDSFNSAIYEYENDLTGVLTNRALFGEGIRWYFILRFRPLRFLTISAKYSETYKPKEKNLGSGYNEIEGNLDNRLSFQMDINI
ncbi:helix-hairpin-helix motif protein [bacterium BMS3Abin03]|nr:helix-hairpin-helix motif protein [bacterium BMS3Abin03]